MSSSAPLTEPAADAATESELVPAIVVSPEPTTRSVEDRASGAPSHSRPSFEAQADLVLLALSVATLGLAAVLRIRDSQAVLLPWVEISLPETCWTRRVLQIDCPGCGLTRSFIRLAHGDWRAAFEFNVAGPLMFALVAAQIPWRTLQIWRDRSGRGRWTAPWWAYSPLAAIVVIMFGQWFWRMLR